MYIKYNGNGKKWFYNDMPNIIDNNLHIDSHIESICFADKIKCVKLNDIVDYKVINNKTVIVYFADGTQTKSVCCDEDTFDLERAIEICILKKSIGENEYHKLIRNALRQIKKIDNDKMLAIKEEEMISRKKKKNAERKAIRKQRKIQEQIDIQSKAFLKAMKEYDELGIKTNFDQFNEEYERLNKKYDIEEE